MLPLVFALLFAPRVECRSTIFGYEGDEWAGGNALYLGRPVGDEFGIAHREWPMGTPVSVRNLRTNEIAFAVVLDRGPYGALDEDGEWFLKAPAGEPDRPGRYRGCADLTPALAEAIGHDGLDRVRIRRLR